MKKNLFVGRFTEDRKFLTKNGTVELVLSSNNHDSDVLHFLMEEAEIENYAVIRGIKKEGQIEDPEIVEVLSPLMSNLIDRLLKGKDNNEKLEAIEEDVISLACELYGLSESEDVAIPPSDEIPDIIPTRRKLCAIVVGHSSRDKGAASPFFNKIQEWDYNCEMAEMIKEQVKYVETNIIFRETTYVALPGQINKTHPDFIVSLHCNSNGPSAYGTEMLYCPGSTRGRELGEYLYQEVCKVFNRSGKGLRGVKAPHPKTGRGMTVLRGTNAPCVITEPFFLSNEKDTKMGLDKKKELASAYARAIDSYALHLANEDDDEKVQASIVDSSPSPSDGVRNPIAIVSEGLSKKKFFELNTKAIAVMIDNSNQWAGREFGEKFSTKLTEIDVVVLGNAEMGLTHDELVDPQFKHSEKEIGLFPLPSNIKDWVGANRSPEWDRYHAVGKNMQAFFDYLVAIKNKVMKKNGNTELYRDLFRIPEIANDKTRQAKLLAGIVHGYFYYGTYADKKVPIQKLMEGFKRDLSIEDIMKSTTYKWAGDVRLRNRQENISNALDWVSCFVA